MSFATASVREVSGPEEATLIRPRIRLFVERVLVEKGWEDYEEIEAPLLQLSFEYPGAKLRVSDTQDRFFSSDGGGVKAMARDYRAEAQAQRVLESFGAVDLRCLDHFGIAPDVDADYVVRVDGDQHAYCAFTTYAVPQLRAMGWRVDLEDSYPYQIVEGEVPWYAKVEEDEDKPDWFNLELGVEVDGKRINLLPVLLDLLDSSNGQQSLEMLERSANRFFALPVSDTRYLPVPPDRLRRILRVMIELYRGEREEGSRIGFEGRMSTVLPQLDEVFVAEGEQLDWVAGEEVRDRGEQLNPARAEHVETPPELKATLRSYQQEGLDFLQHLRINDVGGVLADDMGLGKTLQTIAHLSVEKAAGRMERPSLVVAPTSLVGNWEREIQKFAPHLNTVLLHGTGRHERWAEADAADVVITSYPLLVRDEERFEGRAFHYIILDEAQTIKNVRSLAHKAVRKVDAAHKLCLTGTPVENNLSELWALFDFLNPGLLGDDRSFRAWYRHPIERMGDEERLLALQQQVAPYIIRRMKNEVATELPPKTELMSPCELTGKQRELYESIRVAAHAQVRHVIKRKGFAASALSILDALMKLRQICCDPRLLKMDAARFVKESAKYQMLFEMLDQQLGQGHRILVFSQFTSMLKLISQGLEERGVGHVALTGSTPNRQRVIDAFEGGEADVFLISLKAGGTGLTLTSADTVIHYDPWWNPAVQAQATDRAYRIGQTKPVFVHNLFVAGSVEERMLGLQKKKKHLANAILGQDCEAGSLTEEDVDVLFAPLGA